MPKVQRSRYVPYRPPRDLSSDRCAILDFNTAGVWAQGLWSDGTTMWVVSYNDDKIYAYNLASKAREASKDFTTLIVAENTDPEGLWSDGTTMWVSDSEDDKIYAYNLDSKAREESKDFNTLDIENNFPVGLWSDGITMWVIDLNKYKIYAYNLASKERDGGKDFNTLIAAGNDGLLGLWSDGTTMWVSDDKNTDDKIYAYNLADQARDADKEFNTLIAAGNRGPYGLWSNGTTMWVSDYSDGKIYAYTATSNCSPDGLRPTAKTAATITIAWTQVPELTYEVSQDNGGSYIDAEDMGMHTFNGLSPGAEYTIKIKASNGPDSAESAAITVSTIPPPADLSSDRCAILDFNTLSVVDPLSKGLWSDGTTMWVSDDTDDKIYAYNLASKLRDELKDFTTLSTAGNDAPVGLWSNGTTMWVSDDNEDKIYAYNLVSKAREADKDFPLDVANTNPQGIWSDEITMWVSDSGDANLYAYNLASKAREASKDFTLDTDNDAPKGLWSDGTTMWVADDDDKIYAYNLESEAREVSKDFTLDAENDNPYGLWSNGTTMWVGDYSDAKLYAYTAASNCPPDGLRPTAKTAATIEIAWTQVPGLNYEVSNDNGAVYIDVGATSTHTFNGLNSGDEYTIKIKVYNGSGSAESAAITVSTIPPPADLSSDRCTGLDFKVAAGTYSEALWSDGTTMWVSDLAKEKLYAYNLESKAWKDSKDFTTLIAAGNIWPEGIWSDGTTMWVSDSNDDKIYAYNLASKARDAGKDFNTLVAAGNVSPQGLWSDGITMWVIDNASEKKIYAYNLKSKAREVSKDFNTLVAAGNVSPQGLWSDGTTMWVTDYSDGKIYAYNLADQARDVDKDFILAAENENPIGLWSDGTTMWVSDYTEKIYAYTAAPNCPPDGLRPTAKTAATIDIAWTQVTGLNYEVSNDNGAIYTDVGVASTHTFNGLSHNTEYTIKIKASNAEGSAESAAITVRTAPLPAVLSSNRCTGLDFNTSDDGIDLVTGLWSDGITMWVSDNSDNKLYAYNLASKERDGGKDFDTLTAAGNTSPLGLWSNGTTMWVGDTGDNKLYAYNLESKAREASKDFPLDAVNDYLVGLWSDGITMWVSDYTDKRLYAYNLASKERDGGKDFTLDAAGNGNPQGIWSDGTTMWVVDPTARKLYAYNLADQAREGDSKDFTLDAENGSAYELWSNGVTVWVNDITDGNEKLYAYTAASNCPPDGLATAKTTTTITIAWTEVAGFTYEVSKENGIGYTGAGDMGTHTFTGLNPDTEYTIKIKASNDPVSLESAAITVRTAPLPAVLSSNRCTGLDFNTSDDGIDLVTGLWSDGITMWVSDNSDNKLYAYNLASKERDGGKDFDTLTAAGNTSPLGLWSNRTTMWVGDTGDNKLYAYNLESKAREASKDFPLDAVNDYLVGLWSDGITMWVSDYYDKKLYAYNLASKERDGGKDFTLDAANADPQGIWSDGTTMWVVDPPDGKLYAYNLADQVRDEGKDFTLDAENSSAYGLWSNGVTVWVNDISDGNEKLYAYTEASNCPPDGLATAKTTTTITIGWTRVHLRG